MIARWPRRRVLVALAFIGIIIAYTDRVNISVAAVAMQEHFAWSQTQKGFILAAFFVGYLCFMFPASLLAARFGGQRVATCSVLAWSLFTLLTPAAAGSSIAALIATRIALGMGEAGIYPATYELFGRWVPPTERGRAAALILSGTPAGTLIGLIGSGWLVQHQGWALPFYVFGVLGLLWLIPWVREVRNDPLTDPRLEAAERALLTARPPSAVSRLPLRRLLFRAPMLGIVAGHVAFTWNLYMLLSWMPSYFREVQHLSIASSGLFAAAPWLSMFAFGNWSGVVADRMIERGVSATTTRKLMQCGALLLSAGFLLALKGAHSPLPALLLLCAATAALACASAGYMAIYLDIAPRGCAVLWR